MKMLNSAMFALVPAMLFACNARADDDLLSQVADLDVKAIADADIEIESFDFDGLDVDKLAENAGSESEDEAIEACFRRFGYGHRGGYGYSYDYNYGYNYRPYYHSHYHCYRPYYTYRPVYTTVYTTVYTPVYTSYWGCY